MLLAVILVEPILAIFAVLPVITPVDVIFVAPIVAKLALAPVMTPVEVISVEPIVAKFAVDPVIVPVDVKFVVLILESPLTVPLLKFQLPVNVPPLIVFVVPVPSVNFPYRVAFVAPILSAVNVPLVNVAVPSVNVVPEIVPFTSNA